jgi:hypothetical protein
MIFRFPVFFDRLMQRLQIIDPVVHDGLFNLELLNKRQGQPKKLLLISLPVSQ